MSEGQTGPDLQGLNGRYEVLGELRGPAGLPTYIGKPKNGNTEVVITVVQAPKGSRTNELSHFAADIQLLESEAHPALVRVLDGQWLGSDAFAVVTEQVQGETLGEQLDRGQCLGHPHIALLLQQVSATLDWARDKGIVHRLVTPDTMRFERDSNRLRIAFVPNAIPITGVADACGDARTIGTLAWAMLTGARYPDDGTAGSLGDVSPNLATRVIDATDNVIHCKEGGDVPDVATFLGIIASADVLKQAEVEMAATKEEYDEQHRNELRKCELQREEVEQRAAEQVALLAGEREEFARSMEEDRAAVEAERAAVQAERVDFERLMAERKERLAGVRTQLDAQRAELEMRLVELEAYRGEVEKARDAALAVAEKARADARASASSMAATASEAAAALPTVPIPPPPRSLKEMKPTKWDKKMRELDVPDSELVGPTGRPRWMIPAGLAALVVILIAAVYGATHRTTVPPRVVHVGGAIVVPTRAAATPIGFIPRAGFFAQPPVAAHTEPGLPAASGATAPAIDSAAGVVQPAAPATVEATAAKTDNAPTEGAMGATSSLIRRQPTQRETDSLNLARGDRARLIHADSLAKARRDSAAASRDTLIQRDTTASPLPVISPSVVPPPVIPPPVIAPDTSTTRR